MIRLASFLVFISIYASGGDICRILADPTAHDKTKVTISGLFQWTREAFYFHFDECQDTFITDGHHWDKSACLKFSEDSGKAQEPIRRVLGRIVDALLPALLLKEIDLEITAIGTIYSRDKYEALHTEGGRRILNGFCFVGRSPVMFEIESIPEMRVIKK